jgi:hypothetical protein
MTIVGEAAGFLTYGAFKASAEAGGFLGGVLSAARAAAIASIVAEGSLVAGAGLAGFAIGQQILRNLEYTGPEPTIRQLYKAPAGSGTLRVTAIAKLTGRPEETFVNDFPSPVVIPVSFETAGSVRQGALVGPNATFVAYIQAGRDLIERGLEVISITAVNGDPVPNLLKLPQFAPVFPVEPFKLPTTVPIAPGIPDFPITPTVPVNPNNEPDENDETAKTPGVVVQIPETGQQITFAPGGVQIQRYRSPATAPFEAPKIPPPPTTPKVAPIECPCPSNEPADIKELLCRVKALESGLLSDGFDYKRTVGAGGQGGVVTGIADELVYVEIAINSFAPNERTQRAAPGTPTVFFIGWFSWMIGNFPSDRTPISYLNHNFIAPPNATGYLYSLHDGATATSAYTTRKAKDYVDLC